MSGQVVGQPETAALPDPGSEAYATKCVGCHTIGGGKLTGPDLKPVAAYARQNLEDAIRKMEKNVGPLSPEEVGHLTDLLLSKDARDRIEAVQQRRLKEELAKLEPGNALKGGALFTGRTPFANGGLACAACHSAAGLGGSLGLDLTNHYQQMGEAPLLSAIEQTAYPTMKPIYEKQAVTKQEAIHLVAYFKSLQGQPAAPGAPPVTAAGMIGAAAVLAGIGLGHRRRLGGTREEMVRRAMSNGKPKHTGENGQ
ncbi:MAG: c-type cytochrome [Candidatus Hydrogenedentes bacterium]|nr:c-type cytochrome [Candidatus Hydrogenedentota bacterium]